MKLTFQNVNTAYSVDYPTNALPNTTHMTYINSHMFGCRETVFRELITKKDVQANMSV